MTPFQSDGSMDEPALRGLVEWQIENGIDFLVPCGTTGETPTLAREEWLRVIEVTIEVAHGRVPIVAGATSNCTSDAVEKAKTVAALPGVDAILTARPTTTSRRRRASTSIFAPSPKRWKAADPVQRARADRANIETATLAGWRRSRTSSASRRPAEIFRRLPTCQRRAGRFLVFSGDDTSRCR